MAKIETTFIRPKEEFNVDTGKAKVTYDGYQNNPHEIELKENLEGDVEGVINDTFKENDNNNVAFTDNEGNEHELITSEGFGDALNEALPSALANAQVIKTTWSELKALRDGGNLIAGSLYRITDYNCTTTQENTRSAGHQFDIVLLALSADKLAEEGWAMMNESNIYDVTFSDGVTKRCWMYITDDNECNLVDIQTKLGIGEIVIDEELTTIDENNHTIIIQSAYSSDELTEENLTYNYFQNSKLEAWKVWYCLDNDTDRFAWADDGETPTITIDVDDIVCPRIPQADIEGKYAWAYNSDVNDPIYTDTKTPKIGDGVYVYADGVFSQDYLAVSVNGFGRGVIYRLIDEFNNDVAYDFKSIQFVRKLTDGEYDADTGTDTWVYTFNGWDGDNSVCIDTSVKTDRVTTRNNVVATSDTSVLTDIVMIASDLCCFNRCNDSFLCTLNKVNNSDVSACVGVDGEIIINVQGLYYICNDALVTTDADDPAIYINNKKVLTET